MVQLGMRQRVRRQEIQNAELRGTQCKYRLQRRFPAAICTSVVQYQQHPEAKSQAPNGTACASDTHGLLQRAHVIAGEIRCVGKETDRKWEEGDDPSVLEFRATEYGRRGKVIASEDVKAGIQKIGINKCARESGFDRKNFVRKLVRGLPVKRNSYSEFERWLKTYDQKSTRATRVLSERSFLRFTVHGPCAWRE